MSALLSPEPLTLSRAEIEEITHLERYSAQARVLEKLGVHFERRPDGSLLVGRDAMRRAMGGHTAVAAIDPNDGDGVNWSVRQ